MLNLISTHLAIAWQLSALRVTVKFARLERMMLKYGYDPAQPRAPAGAYDGSTAIGGRWIDSVTGPDTPDRIHVAVSAFDNPGLYYVDLSAEDRKGGHGFSKHVGKSAGYLKAYVIAWNMNPANQHHPAEGSFHSLGEANNLVSAALRANPEIVQRAINGERNLPILHRFGFNTGYEAYQSTPTAIPIIRETYWVEVYITHDPRQGGKGYRVVTAYPMNDIPDETARKHSGFLEF